MTDSIVFKRPSGSEITVANTAANIKQAEVLGWTRSKKAADPELTEEEKDEALRAAIEKRRKAIASERRRVVE